MTIDAPVPTHTSAPVLELADVVKRYPAGGRSAQRAVLKGVDYAFESGRMYAVIGPSGSGKTTLLSLASGLDAPTSGSIRFRGTDLNRLGLDTYRRKHAATVFQSFNLLGYMTALQNITSAMEITGTRHRGRRRRAEELLDATGIPPEDRNRRIDRLSGGQQQRVAISRALACDVDILFADEPTGSLDQDTAQDIIDLFRKLAHDDGKCVIVVTHSREVARASDDVLHLKRGKLSPR
ncbi:MULTISPECIES: ABC transporter ATP-binding protein [unclassified Streptomyces]|uniref:ABC transporter ATP-binding protein n=1 Tax=unclassified Streptomyces TaxID=2593676 RepID=UPI000DBAD639|nr:MULTISPECIES: ABC transporter ATP-binding protein [unclassified Streptomyces]MYT73427.1 ATP-binding cassette domain-containing protein [Streptomyces sp. SID8367]RAJ84955.1 putative ABC transport system ATP-binding protein [Streptomyces sp. PsTaAH-137]